jgi:hypothetical protein
MEIKICRVCGKEKLESQMRPGKRYCYSCSGIRERARLKLEMLEAFGWKCECCGETNPLFLTLDHRIPGQSYHTTGLNTQQLYRVARREGWPKDKYQLLCMNCNYAKGYFGACPHTQPDVLSTEKVIEQLRTNNFVLERDYSVVTEKQKEALKLGPKSQQVNPIKSLEDHYSKQGLDVQEIIRRLKEKK